MTTKEQERKALEQMKKIVANLGEGSYIGMAFEGAWELAEQNIEWDAAYSVTDSIESARRDEAKANAEAEDAKNKVEAAKTEVKLAEGRRAEAERVADGLREQMHHLDERLCAKDAENIKLEAKVTEYEGEIMRLKAMLFDIMYSDKAVG